MIFFTQRPIVLMIFFTQWRPHCVNDFFYQDLVANALFLCLL